MKRNGGWGGISGITELSEVWGRVRMVGASPSPPSPHADQPSGGAVLVFMPGLAEITKMQEACLAHPRVRGSGGMKGEGGG